MTAEMLRAAAVQARAEADGHRTVAPILTKDWGDDLGAEQAARRHVAVADWLDQTARLHESGSTGPLDMPAAMAVATAYLGENQ